jgi:dihydrofolate synthase/folylpolyglutamate synthase
MSFAAAVDHLHALGLELAPDPTSSAPRRKFDLEHMRILAAALGDPQQQFPAILIAGTNGKGSTGATLAAILAAAGYRTGLYTSPHLSRVTERIRISQSTPPLSFRNAAEESASQPATSNPPLSFRSGTEESASRPPTSNPPLSFRSAVEESASQPATSNPPLSFRSAAEESASQPATSNPPLSFRSAAEESASQPTTSNPPLSFRGAAEESASQPATSNPPLSFRSAAEESASQPATSNPPLSFRSAAEESASQPASSAPQPATFFEIPEPDFARLYFRVDEAANRLVSTGQLPHHPSFFESLTALAFLYFAGEQTAEATRPPVDIAILEVGLGGRLDATNIVEPILSVITDIALDHQDYLGNTITAIAREKAGILRPNGTLITLPQHPEANQSIGEVAMALNVRGINAADFLPGRGALPGREFTPPPTRVAPTPDARREPFRDDPGDTSRSGSPAFRSSSGLVARGFSLGSPAENLPQDPGTSAPAAAPHSPLPLNNYTLTVDNQPLRVRSPLAGQHQQRNIALAIAAAIELRNINSYNITNAAIEAGIANTSWPGRLEFLPPNLLLDVAHNPAGAWTLRAAIATLPEALPRTLIFSCLRDKDLTEMAQILFPLFDATGGRPHDHIVLAPIQNPRAASLDDLLAAARKLDIPAHPAQDPAEALTLARSLTPANGLIIATGSIYLIGALRNLALTH